MDHYIRLCLVLHNHQPVGNFDGVYQQAFEDSYLPFLDVFEEYPDIRISLHTSGPLMEWLDANQPRYVDRLARLAADGRMEIVGGAFYEPILTMIPPRDRVAQISGYTEWLQRRLQTTVQGMWIPERVWEQSIASDIADAGIRYTILDDFHFKNCGLNADQLFGYYTTEDNGRTLSVFPGSERLRYTIPFEDPNATIDHLRYVAQVQPGAVVVFGDDGEKFGTWPNTKQHVYDRGWLRNFFQTLGDNSDWLITTTLAEAHDSVAPLGKTYIPECSYREMTEWALPAMRQLAYHDVKHRLQHEMHQWNEIQDFVRGGIWRNFKTRYPETDEMYSRMIGISRRLAEVKATFGESSQIQRAQQELYRGQCNCAYWHGAFGGVYLPHLRNAVYSHLIAAENYLDLATHAAPIRVSATAADYNLDGRDEVRLENEQFVCLLSPNEGGQWYEFDVRAIRHNLLATLARREEAYHQKVRQGPSDNPDGVASIHDQVVFKQAGLDDRLFYDTYRRKSLIDHFYSPQTTVESVMRGEATEWGNFINEPYTTVIRRKPDRVQVVLSARGEVDSASLQLTKAITMESGSHTIEIAYMLEGLPSDRTLHFSPEFNFAGLPAGQDDRYYFGEDGKPFSQLGEQLDQQDCEFLGVADEWLGIRLELRVDGPTHWWAYPIQTVSQSEGGFELVHQSIAIHPHWHVQGDNEGRWIRTLKLQTTTRERPTVEEKQSTVAAS